jgi:regulator of protease activity HflC (stomatin/prohibitin superfamily)
VAGAAENVLALLVPEHHVVVLYVDGKAQRLLDAGLHAFWKANRDLRGELVDLRLQVLEVAGQEILTKDKVTLRVNLTAGYRVSDVLTAFSKQAKPVDFLYKELQFGLRAAVGTRTLDELLENKTVIDEVVGGHIRRRVQGFGLEVESVGVKDIILPGDMKLILAKVVEAEKAAQANVIRRREETAATRSLLNTAKVMEDNPTALRLKELETLEKVTEKIDKISVFGGLEGVLKDLVKIR